MTDQTKIELTPEEIKQIVQEYNLDLDDPMNYDDELVEVFSAVNKLPAPERLILILYAELQSQRKLGSVLGVSHGTCLKALRQIREKLNRIMEDDKRRKES